MNSDVTDTVTSHDGSLAAQCEARAAPDSEAESRTVRVTQHTERRDSETSESAAGPCWRRPPLQLRSSVKLLN